MLSQQEIARYDRQIRLLGEEAQKKLKNTSVLIAGAGGLGSFIAYHIASLGIGKVFIVDKGVVDVPDLNRQILYTTEDLGKPKADVACERLRKYNPFIEIECIPKALDEELLEKLMPRVDVVIDALDNWETRLLLNKHVVKYRKVLIHGGVDSFYGQITTIVPGKTPCLQCIVGSRPKSKDVVPIVSPVVGVIGSLQVMELLKIVLNIGTPLCNKLLVYDALSNTFTLINIARNPSCPICASINQSN